ncbi:MAG TPA: hypothetical protein DCW68_00990 [Rhodospirillaceae bacterium]|nr:MAG: hypothetical protein A2018_00625 [Alphaproteobacteria bacterium GWF2_58_20]HAU28675.1 hypothetical protein [Rhodospirillaceae bacterium]
MKKTSTKRKRFLDLRSQRIPQQKKLRKDLLKRRKCAHHSATKHNQGRFITLHAPENFDILENHDEVIDFIKRIDLEADLKNKKTYIDLTNISRLTPVSALVLAASIDKWRNITNINKLTAKNVGQWNKSVLKSFHDLGFFEILNTNNHQSIESALDGIPSEFEDRTFLKMMNGQLVDGSNPNTLIAIIHAMVGENYKPLLYRPIIEAMGNAVEHAYSRTYDKRLPKWWMTGHYDKGKHILSIMLLDFGVGIPKKFKRDQVAKTFLSSIWATLITKDSSLIEKAVHFRKILKESPIPDRSGRNWGLWDMAEVATISPGGKLTILSGKGLYNREGENYNSKEYRTPFGGTLIEWTLDVQSHEVGEACNGQG